MKAGGYPKALETGALTYPSQRTSGAPGGDNTLCCYSNFPKGAQSREET